MSSLNEIFLKKRLRIINFKQLTLNSCSAILLRLCVMQNTLQLPFFSFFLFLFLLGAFGRTGSYQVVLLSQVANENHNLSTNRVPMATKMNDDI